MKNRIKELEKIEKTKMEIETFNGVKMRYIIDLDLWDGNDEFLDDVEKDLEVIELVENIIKQGFLKEVEPFEKELELKEFSFFETDDEKYDLLTIFDIFKKGKKEDISRLNRLLNKNEALKKCRWSGVYLGRKTNMTIGSNLDYTIDNLIKKVFYGQRIDPKSIAELKEYIEYNKNDDESWDELFDFETGE